MDSIFYRFGINISRVNDHIVWSAIEFFKNIFIRYIFIGVKTRCTYENKDQKQ